MSIEAPEAETLLRSWSGRTISTFTGAPNRILAVEGDAAIIGTERSPQGQPVPLAMVRGWPIAGATSYRYCRAVSSVPVTQGPGAPSAGGCAARRSGSAAAALVA